MTRKLPDRFKDTQKAEGVSEFKPVRSEGYKSRHTRRLINANRQHDQLKEWCDVMGVAFRTANNELHWMLRYEGHGAEWWPSTAKLVIDKQFKQGIHAHTVHQVMDTLAKRWGMLQESRKS